MLGIKTSRGLQNLTQLAALIGDDETQLTLQTERINAVTKQYSEGVVMACSNIWESNMEEMIEIRKRKESNSLPCDEISSAFLTSSSGAFVNTLKSRTKQGNEEKDIRMKVEPPATVDLTPVKIVQWNEENKETAFPETTFPIVEPKTEAKVFDSQTCQEASTSDAKSKGNLPNLQALFVKDNDNLEEMEYEDEPFHNMDNVMRPNLVGSMKFFKAQPARYHDNYDERGFSKATVETEMPPSKPTIDGTDRNVSTCSSQVKEKYEQEKRKSLGGPKRTKPHKHPRTRIKPATQTFVKHYLSNKESKKRNKTTSTPQNFQSMTTHNTISESINHHPSQNLSNRPLLEKLYIEPVTCMKPNTRRKLKKKLAESKIAYCPSPKKTKKKPNLSSKVTRSENKQDKINKHVGWLTSDEEGD